jgi:predicted esterase
MGLVDHGRRGVWPGLTWAAAGWLAAAWLAATAGAAEVYLKDGRVLKGRFSETSGLAEGSSAVVNQTGARSIIFVVDELRRTFVSKHQLQEVRPDSAGQPEEKFNVRQPTVRGNTRVVSIGPPAKPVEDFDKFGHRSFTMLTARGPLTVIQAITEVTPQWVKVEGLNYIWDMRIATSTIPHTILREILLNQIDPKNLEHRKKIAKFLLQSERYEDARKELLGIIQDFPERTDVKQQLGAQQLLAELKLRRAAGQHQLVRAMLKKFPTEDVAGDILQAVREMLDQYEAQDADRAKMLEACTSLSAGVADPAARAKLDKLSAEISAEMTIDMLPRMAALRQNLNMPQTSAEEKLALADSGWLVGADSATPKLAAAMSLWRVRNLAEKYFREPLKLHRNGLLQVLPSEDAATAALLAALVSHMKPPLVPPEPVDVETPGYYRLEAVGLPKETPVVYYLQLPPEYNPYRRYPMIVSLNGLTSTPEQQIDWWAGMQSARGRLGQASRRGYIVLAPTWTIEHQKEYEYSAREHAAVLSSVRDACRRFAVDTDRVFLSGYSAGGDAAWDIGLAHPDLWAGVIPIAGESKRYCMFYWENARNLPFYVVEGELDGGRLTRCARDLDRYLEHGFNTTVVEYLGRGHENFTDEQLRLFDWMGRFRRNFFPREFSCVSMRPWDNFFWWAEAEGLPAGSMVNPASWPPPRNTLPAMVKGSMSNHNSLVLRTGSSRVTVWLSPEMIDFHERVNISVGGHRVTTPSSLVRPSLETLLEDVRTRGDRQHPFWAKIEVPSGK